VSVTTGVIQAIPLFVKAWEQHRLSACPYCGGDPFGGGSAFTGWVASCVRCGASGPSKRSIQEAAESWNRRVLSSELTPERVLASEILAELIKARTKFPGDNVTGLALVEEVGELAKALIDESRARVREEAVQVATMAMRVVLDGDSTVDGWRQRKGLDPLVPASS
jgi:Lar family restriction alleviation protein